MKIGYLYGFNSSPPVTGGGIHVYNLVQKLTELGHVVHAFEPEENTNCLAYPNSSPGIRRFLETIDVLYVRIDGSFISHSHLKLACMEQIQRKKIVWEINAPTDEALAKLRTDARAYSNSRSICSRLKYTARDLSFRYAVSSEARVRRKLAKHVDAAICVSEPLKQYAALDLGIERCEVIPNGSGPVLACTGKRADLFKDYSDYFKVIYAGASEWFWQDFETMSKLADLAEEQNQKILFIVLDNSGSSIVKTRRNLLVVNRVDYFEIPSYLASVDACLCLYHEFSWSRYGFYLSPLKLYDYMASGKPVIASRVGQIASVVEDGKDGLLVTADPYDIYEKILFCRSSRVKAEQLGECGRQKVQDFYNWDRVAAATVRVFRSVMNDMPGFVTERH